MYIIEDDNKTRAFEMVNLAHLLLNETRDVPLAFSDKVFSHENGTDTAPLFYPVAISDGDGGPLPSFSILPEMFGYNPTVNGVIYPYHNVSNEGHYLFRLLNACDSRFLRLYFEVVDSNGTIVDNNGTRLEFTVVANDQGLLSDTTIEDEILVGPAPERYEIIVTFSDFPDGTLLTLFNSEITLLGPVIPDVDDQLLVPMNLYPSPFQAGIPTWSRMTSSSSC
jgi:FtsP/CotA-like multicopper oxidase with cupredoxin domain